MRYRSLRILSVVLAATLAISGMVIGNEVTTVVVGMVADATNLDCQLHTDCGTHAMLNGNLYEALVKYGPTRQPVPLLATGWEMINDLTWRFYLRKGVRFHNGEPFNAEAVKWNFDRFMDESFPTSGWAYLAVRTTVKEVRVVDSYTVDFVTKEPDALFMAGIPWIVMLPPEYIETKGDSWVEKPVGTGPMCFGDWKRDQQLVLERSDTYWGSLPEVERLIFRPIPETAARVAALRAGEVDIVYWISPELAADVEATPGLKKAIAPAERFIYLGLDALDPPLDDRRVRQALNYAVNIPEIVEFILQGYATAPVVGAFFPVTIGFDPGIEPYSYNPEKARELLKEAGYDGLDVTLSVTPGIEGALKLKEVSEAMAGQMAKAGINLSIEFVDSARFWELYSNRAYQMYFLTWGSSPESGRHLFSLFHSEVRGYYWANSETDKLLDQYVTTLDVNDRAKVGRILQAHLQEEAPYIFMYIEDGIYGLNARIDWNPTGTRWIDVKEIDVME